ncbi:hypothetical protein CDD80_2178 [Ophiocordyceps camponoti-rufipedis]|uniref:Nuclear pore complex protein Nup85 n=1 Tax=Ophiocordyceps camponoti-rufipedis TaxID=2004952 RepID=A0A2C5XKS3_9HYPO|nr:hypothetical protein CDD80_2178 [Ophiocordyceps camponoti-rufipedis]
MADRFMVQDSSPIANPAPSTPDGKNRRAFISGMPSTTPAGPPPQPSFGSLTPAGAPSESLFGSSLLRQNSRPVAQPKNNASWNRQHGRSVRQPSNLSRQYLVDDQDSDGEEVGDEPELPPLAGSLFRGTGAETDDIEAAISKYIDQDMDAAEEESESESSSDVDMFLNMRHDDRPYDEPPIGEGDDMIMLNTPAAISRVQKEAEDIFRRSTARFGGGPGSREFQLAAVARGFYLDQRPAPISESPQLVLETDSLVGRLYDEGVGTEDDADKMDNSLASITCHLIRLWDEYAAGLPQPEGECVATVGPGLESEPFQKAAFIAHLMVRIHHTRFDVDSAAVTDKTPPLAEVMFDWLQQSHNLYPDQVRDIARCKPSPASHGLYWQTVRCAVIRGEVKDAARLLRNAGWDQLRECQSGDAVYAHQALDNICRYAEATSAMLEQCPAAVSDWDVDNASWTLFRVQAQASLDRMTLFAEGNLDGAAARRPQTMSAMARKAASQIPWEVYENLQVIYGIVLGNIDSILNTAQDWCEATVGILGWWNKCRAPLETPGVSTMLAASMASLSRPAARDPDEDDQLGRLAAAFHFVLASDMSPNPTNAVEVAVGSIFEGNVDAVIGCLRTWSLPVASSVAEIASLGMWLPPPQPAKPPPMDALDMDDLALLGVAPPTVDETEGIKDTTLIMYARELAGIEHLSPSRDGWELAIRVLGRMDSAEKADETVAELLRDLLETLDLDSSAVVDKIWGVLNDLGMAKYAEHTAMTYAQMLARECRHFGEVLWYYALAHRPDSVRDVLNLLMAHSLVDSRAFPAEADLDDGLRDLLEKRTETLERRATQDLEAAQLLGRMLSGYATLRKFYDIRDGSGSGPKMGMSARKRQAARALAAVIASADDNIRGGLLDQERGAVVSEDYLLALLGEATALVDGGGSGRDEAGPVAMAAEHIEVLLKAVEDLETVGGRVLAASEDFFGTVLASCPGLKGAAPSDLMMRRSTGSLSSSYVMSGSSMLASRLHETAHEGGGCAEEVEEGVGEGFGGVVAGGGGWGGQLIVASSAAALRPVYQRILTTYNAARRILGQNRPLNLSEKLLYSHLDSPSASLAPGSDAPLRLRPDRVNMQDASAQMALLQLLACGPSARAAIPASIHCDHLIVGARGADDDLEAGLEANAEVFAFLESAARRFGLDFWPPGAGIIHQTVLENYALPGLMMLGTDSHSPNAGGMCTFTVGVGGADAVEALVGAPWELRRPAVHGIELVGKLGGWASPKDVILKLAGMLSVRGGTGAVLEYFGPGVESLSLTGMATIANMGAEVGATTSVFPYTDATARYLCSTGRDWAVEAVSSLANHPEGSLRFSADEGASYDRVTRIDLSHLEPHINGPFTPDLSTPISTFKHAVSQNNWPTKLSAALIGSCTNSSYQDMTRAQDLLAQARNAGLKPASPLYVTPGSEQIRATLERDGAIDEVRGAGGTVLANACGPCIGQWKRGDGVGDGETNAIFTSYNRNFRGRNDGNGETMNFLASPEIVTAMAFAGSTTFNPVTDSLTTPTGSDFRFQPPSGLEDPPSGFDPGRCSLSVISSPADASIPVAISPTSERLALLEPFAPFPPSDLSNLRILIKIKGKCTTDTISAAGPWLKYKGHLTNISANTLNTAVNAATDEVNTAYDLDGTKHTIPSLALAWKSKRRDWIIVAEHNYGEGSAREHAALQPRFLGARLVLAKSFARIHETNLKKQGVVPLTFADEGDYERVKAGDEVETVGLYAIQRASSSSPDTN